MYKLIADSINTVLLDKPISFYGLEPSSADIPPNSVLNMYDQKHIGLKNLKSFNPQKAKRINYKTNNFGHRSEDFNTLNPNKTNILFIGCSATFGEALPDNQYWPYYIYDTFKDKGYDLGPIQILSYMGGSIETIIDNTFKYIKMFGKPDYIFALFPDIFRSKEYNFSLKKFDVKLMDDAISEWPSEQIKQYIIKSLYNYNIWYNSLEVFCKNENINLISTTWQQDVVEFIAQLHQSTFVPFSLDMVQPFIESKKADKFLKNVDRDFLWYSADGLHIGIYNSLFFADLLMQHGEKLGVL